MKRIITIGREFGSGGREFGRRIAEKLQIAYFDQEIITEIAKRTAMSEEYVRQIEEMQPHNELSHSNWAQLLYDVGCHVPPRSFNLYQAARPDP